MDSAVTWAKEHPRLTAAIAVAVVGAGVYAAARKASNKTETKTPATTTTATSKTTTKSTTNTSSSSSTSAKKVAGGNVTVPEDISEEALKEKNLGNDAFKARKYKEAMDHYTKAIAMSESSQCAVFFSNRAACHSALEQYTDVVSDCTAAIAIDRHYVKALNRRAQAYEHLGQHQEALRDYTVVCILSKFENRPVMECAERVLATIGRTFAEKHLQTREPVIPGPYTVGSYLESFPQSSPEPLSLAELKALVDSDNNNGVNRLRLAKKLSQLNKHEGVLSVATEAITLLEDLKGEERNAAQQSLVDAYELAGMYSHIGGQATQALQYFEKVLTLQPDHMGVLLRRSTTLLENGQHALAADSVSAAIALSPASFYPYYHRAQLHLVKSDNGSAIEDFEKAAELNPTIPAVYIQLALAKLKHQDIAGCEKQFSEAATKFPNHPDVDIFRAQFFLQTGRVEQGEAALEAAKAKDALCPLPYFFQAQVALQMGHIDECITLLQKSVQIDSKFDPAYQQLAQLFLRKKDMTTALEYFDKVLQLARSAEDLTTTFACREAAIAQQHVIANDPELQVIVETLTP